MTQRGRHSSKWQAAAVALLIALSGCQGASTDASPAFAEAFALYGELQSETGLRAEDPRADKALKLLAQVPDRSVDSEAAKNLSEAVRAWKAERAAFWAAHTPKDEPARAPVVDDSDPFAPTPTPTPEPPTPGGEWGEVAKRYGGCLREEAPFIENRTNQQGTAWALVDSDACRQKHPELDGQLLLSAGSKLYRVAPAADTNRIEAVRGDAGFVPVTAGSGH